MEALMLYFQSVRTARFTFTLQELTFEAVRHLLNIPPQRAEKSRSAFIRYAVKELQWHKGYENLTFDDLTIQERLFIEATYLSEVSDQNNFSLGNGNYTDYLLYQQQYHHSSFELGSIPNDDDVWSIKPLTSLESEIIEERVLSLDEYERIDWILFAMAVQLYRKGEETPELKSDPLAYGDWLEERVMRLSRLPESAMLHLIQMYFSGLSQLAHLFDVNMDGYGFIVLPVNKTKLNEEGEEIALFPARFRPTSKLSPLSQELFGKHHEIDTYPSDTI